MDRHRSRRLRSPEDPESRRGDEGTLDCLSRTERTFVAEVEGKTSSISLRQHASSAIRPGFRRLVTPRRSLSARQPERFACVVLETSACLKHPAGLNWRFAGRLGKDFSPLHFFTETFLSLSWLPNCGQLKLLNGPLLSLHPSLSYQHNSVRVFIGMEHVFATPSLASKGWRPDDLSTDNLHVKQRHFLEWFSYPSRRTVLSVGDHPFSSDPLEEKKKANGDPFFVAMETFVKFSLAVLLKCRIIG